MGNWHIFLLVRLKKKKYNAPSLPRVQMQNPRMNSPGLVREFSSTDSVVLPQHSPQTASRSGTQQTRQVPRMRSSGVCCGEWSRVGKTVYVNSVIGSFSSDSSDNDAILCACIVSLSPSGVVFGVIGTIH
ncbi:hypothetical protein IscW_ISCW015501 [Ixodes scapularis]|uniref:Uncharacterized protein n=1 Tax=Ixodes scapularis TaxID=6945 RepID=B7QP13_IXOSC|nr:hypothetical protein IscW_ISCW015501 [Ixodes scapularis]|eukprot:XP_002416668.1 hypothetical protein IscW_ISCW015501 [Ixodes scapularis]